MRIATFDATGVGVRFIIPPLLRGMFKIEPVLSERHATKGTQIAYILKDKLIPFSISLFGVFPTKIALVFLH
jgi:hypothetical protein